MTEGPTRSGSAMTADPILAHGDTCFGVSDERGGTGPRSVPVLAGCLEGLPVPLPPPP